MSRYSARKGKIEYIIENDEAVGWYLYVMNEAICTEDYLQDSYAAVVQFASAKFGIEEREWQPKPEQNS